MYWCQIVVEKALDRQHSSTASEDINFCGIVESLSLHRCRLMRTIVKISNGARKFGAIEKLLAKIKPELPEATKKRREKKILQKKRKITLK